MLYSLIFQWFNLILFKGFLKKQQLEGMNTLMSDKIESAIADLINCEAVREHKINSKVQRDIYNFQRKDKYFLKNKILIDLDFKQKIVIGLSPIQVNSEYYNLDNRTCLGEL